MKNIIARVKTKEQFNAVINFNEIYTVIGSSAVFSLMRDRDDKEFFLSLPDVLRENKVKQAKVDINKAKEANTGVLIKNIDELSMAKEMEFAKDVIGDSFLYAYNDFAFDFYKSIFPNMKFILSDELSDKELESLKEVSKENLIYKAYGYQQLMITNQCMNRNYWGCLKPLLKFKDDKNNEFYVSSECGYCYDIVYNGQPTNMLDKLDEIKFENILLDFTIESEEETKSVIEIALNAAKHVPISLKNKYTRGHHYKGVD